MSTLVKICGITRAEDAHEAVRLGAFAIGFIFQPKSPRYIAPDAARAIADSLPASVVKVGVFVDEPPHAVQTAVEHAGVQVAQLHGDESPAMCSSSAARVWKALRVSHATGAERQVLIERAATYAGCEALLIDALSTKGHGGTGERSDWTVAADLAAKHRVILAGGLNAENVAEAIRAVHPYAVDVSSGVEDAPGRKNFEKMAALFDQVKQVNESAISEPNARGWFGEFGGRMVPETLVAPLQELEDAYLAARNDPAFQAELEMLLTSYVGRPTPLFIADRLTAKAGGATIVLKREDLTHTGAHKINNAIGQILLARRMGKRRIIAETGAGQHGVATAAAAAQFGMDCTVYMGRVDMERQAPNVSRMRLMGAKVVPVDSGAKTLKEAVSEAMRDWVSRVRDTYYVLGSALGPHPYPLMVRDFQKIIGEEARAQIIDRCGGLPNEVVACVGGGSNAIGLFYAFIGDRDVKLTGVEAGGRSMELGEHAARFAHKKLGILQGTTTYVLQDEHGQVADTHSISAGLDYAAVGPEHALLESIGRARYTSVTDKEALQAFKTLAELEGILPALESSHAIAYALKTAGALPKGQTMLVGLSGRGDKDMASALAAMEASDAQ